MEIVLYFFITILNKTDLKQLCPKNITMKNMRCWLQSTYRCILDSWKTKWKEASLENEYISCICTEEDMKHLMN